MYHAVTAVLGLEHIVSHAMGSHLFLWVSSYTWSYQPELSKIFSSNLDPKWAMFVNLLKYRLFMLVGTLSGFGECLLLQPFTTWWLHSE